MLADLSAGEPRTFEAFVARWLPILLRLVGFNRDHANLLAVIAEATWPVVRATGHLALLRSGLDPHARRS